MVRGRNEVAASRAVIKVRIFILSGSEGGSGIDGVRQAGAGSLSKLVRLTVILLAASKFVTDVVCGLKKEKQRDETRSFMPKE